MCDEAKVQGLHSSLKTVQMNNILVDALAYMQLYADRWSFLRRNCSLPPRLPPRPVSIAIRYCDGSGKGLSRNRRAIEMVGEFSIRTRSPVLSHSRSLHNFGLRSGQLFVRSRQRLMLSGVCNKSTGTSGTRRHRI